MSLRKRQFRPIIGRKIADDLPGARVNRALEIDTETGMIKNDDEANKMLTREYREPFVVPEVV